MSMPCLPRPFFLPDRASLDDATDLIGRFGKAARREAEARAEGYRTRGNLHRFCRWRQIGRAIALLSDEDVTGTVH